MGHLIGSRMPLLQEAHFSTVISDGENGIGINVENYVYINVENNVEKSVEINVEMQV